MTPAEIEAIRARRQMVSTTCGACGAPATHYRLPSQRLPGDGYYVVAQCEEHIGQSRAPLPPGTTQAWGDIAALLDEVERLTVARQDDARRYVQDLYLKNSPGFLDSLEDAIGLGRSGDDTLTRLARIIEGAASLRAMVPRLEWRKRIDVEEATIGAFALLVESDGWRLEVCDGTGDYWIVDSGPETGPEGKAAAVAAWQRACGGAQ